MQAHTQIKILTSSYFIKYMLYFLIVCCFYCASVFRKFQISSKSWMQKTHFLICLTKPLYRYGYAAIHTQKNANVLKDHHSHVLQLQIISIILLYMVIADIFCIQFLVGICLRNEKFADTFFQYFLLIAEVLEEFYEFLSRQSTIRLKSKLSGEFQQYSVSKLGVCYSDTY